MRVLTAAAALAALILSGCGAGAARPDERATDPQLRLVVHAASGWSADELKLAAEPDGAGGWAVTLASTADAPARELYAEVEHAAGLQVVAAEQHCDGELSLLATGTPGVVGLGVVTVPDAPLRACTLLSFRLVQAQSAAEAPRAAAAADTRCATDLTVVERTADTLSLRWSYALAGDYDQNGEINAADLAPVANHFRKTGPFDYSSIESVVDGDANGEINAADISPIASGFRSQLGGYSIWSAAATDLADPELLGAVQFQQAQGDTGRKYFEADATTLPAADPAFLHVTAGPVELAPSNVVESLRPDPPVDPLFEVPPPGLATIDTSTAISPSLAFLPGNGGAVEEGAPVVAYIVPANGGELNLARYDEGAWVSEPLVAGNYGLVQLIVHADIRAAAVWEFSTGDVKVLFFDELWQPLPESRTVLTSSQVTKFEVDVTPEGKIGLLILRDGSAEVHYGPLDPTSLWVSHGIVTPDSQLDATFCWDAAAEGHLLVSHGTIDTTDTILISTTLLHAYTELEVNWQLEEVTYADSPMLLDAYADESGELQVVFTAARDLTTSPPLPAFTASLYFDGVAATRDAGGLWSFEKYFTSTLTPGLVGFPPSAVDLELALNLTTTWAAPNEVCYGVADGTVRLAFPDMTPESGSVSNSVRYAINSGGGFSDSTFFTGDPGIAMSWDQRGPLHGAAYLRLETLSYEDVLSGEFGGAGELLFWRAP